jgi:hypothetical protein
MEGTSRELITESIANTNERVNPAHRSARKPEREERDRIHTARNSPGIAGHRYYFLLFFIIIPKRNYILIWNTSVFDDRHAQFPSLCLIWDSAKNVQAPRRGSEASFSGGFSGIISTLPCCGFSPDRSSRIRTVTSPPRQGQGTYLRTHRSTSSSAG